MLVSCCNMDMNVSSRISSRVSKAQFDFVRTRTWSQLSQAGKASS